MFDYELRISDCMSFNSELHSCVELTQFILSPELKSSLIQINGKLSQWILFACRIFHMKLWHQYKKRIYRERAERRKKDQHTNVLDKKKPKENLNRHEKQKSQVPTQLTIHGICTWFWAQHIHFVSEI